MGLFPFVLEWDGLSYVAKPLIMIIDPWNMGPGLLNYKIGTTSIPSLDLGTRRMDTLTTNFLVGLISLKILTNN